MQIPLLHPQKGTFLLVQNVVQWSETNEKSISRFIFSLWDMIIRNYSLPPYIRPLRVIPSWPHVDPTLPPPFSSSQKEPFLSVQNVAQCTETNEKLMFQNFSFWDIIGQNSQNKNLNFLTIVYKFECLDISLPLFDCIKFLQLISNLNNVFQQ